MKTPTATLAVPLRAVAASLLLHAAVGTYAFGHALLAEARADWAGSANEVAVSFQLSMRGPEPAVEVPAVDLERPRHEVPDLAMPEPEIELAAQPAERVVSAPWQGAAALPVPEEFRNPAADRYRLPLPPERTAEPAAVPAAAPATPLVPEPAASDAPSPDLADAAFVPASPAVGRNHEPRYPASARRQGVQGTVTVALEIDAAGAVTAAKVAVSSGNLLLDGEAVRCLRQWRFEPARRLGVAVASRLDQQVVFRLVP